MALIAVHDGNRRALACRQRALQEALVLRLRRGSVAIRSTCNCLCAERESKGPRSRLKSGRDTREPEARAARPTCARRAPCAPARDVAPRVFTGDRLLSATTRARCPAERPSFPYDRESNNSEDRESDESGICGNCNSSPGSIRRRANCRPRRHRIPRPTGLGSTRWGGGGHIRTLQLRQAFQRPAPPVKHLHCRVWRRRDADEGGSWRQ